MWKAESRDQWSVNSGSKQPYIWNHRLKFVYSPYNFYEATMTIKGPLQVRLSPLGVFFRSRKTHIQKWSQNSNFWGKGLNIKFWFSDTEKAHSCA